MKSLARNVGRQMDSLTGNQKRLGRGRKTMTKTCETCKFESTYGQNYPCNRCICRTDDKYWEAKEDEVTDQVIYIYMGSIQFSFIVYE